MICISWTLLVRGVFFLLPRFISSERSPPKPFWFSFVHKSLVVWVTCNSAHFH